MAMDDGKVLITGACGFLGNLLATHLAPHHPNKLILLDHASPPPTLVSGAHYVRRFFIFHLSMQFAFLLLFLSSGCNPEWGVGFWVHGHVSD